jgi:hypothetical protein
MRRGVTIDSARAAVAGAVPAGVVHRVQRTAADGTIRLQFPVPLVREMQYRRPGRGGDGHERQLGYQTILSQLIEAVTGGAFSIILQ